MKGGADEHHNVAVAKDDRPVGGVASMKGGTDEHRDLPRRAVGRVEPIASMKGSAACTATGPAAIGIIVCRVASMKGGTGKAPRSRHR
jgi:hypothetical protein